MFIARKFVKKIVCCTMFFFIGCSTFKVIGVLKDGSIQGLALGQKISILFSACGKLIIIPVYLKGFPRVLNFILDTGAGATVIDSAIAKELKLETATKVKKRGIENQFTVSNMVILPTLSIGSISADKIGAVSMDLNKLTLESGIKIDGVIGENFLNHFVLSINYKNHEIFFSKNDSAFAEIRGTKIKMDNSLMNSFLPIMLGNTHQNSQLKLYFDSGMNGWMQIPSSLIKKFVSDSSHIISSKGIIGHSASGGLNARMYRLDSINIGKITLKNIPAIISDLPFIPLGQKVMAEFKIVFDFPAHQIWFVPIDTSSQFIDFSFYPRGTGLIIERIHDGVIKVAGIWRESPADRSGIQVGDEIVSVAGLSVKDIEAWKLKEWIETGESESTIDIIIKKSKSGETQNLNIPIGNYLP
jgi:hypothetical protein